MKKIAAVLLVNAIILGSLAAQNFAPIIQNSSFKLNSGSFNSNELRILAVMVEFAEDRDTQTFGNGKFGSIYSKDYGNDILDPLPHDIQYFSNHLLFAKNYFKKVSNGKLNIEYNILPGVITVSKTMRNYSPPSDSKIFEEVGNFASEVWHKADSLNAGFNFSDYDMFIIFHAGVSRGLITPGSIGLERDIPSLYLGPNSLKKIFGEQFTGFPVSNGNFSISNSAIMPETDSRELDSFTGKSLIELSTNGLLCTTVANFLGVPDLFDTETGKSAIGRFGLMDPQGFYAYQGIFPPEPSPWVKMFLGWITPVTVNLQDVRAELTAQRAAEAGDTVILKVPLNSDEYYLVENRSRDAMNDGAIVTYVLDGQTFTKTFPYDVDGFRFFDVDTINGVVTDIDEPDWAVPGIDSNDKDGIFKDVGIVIWHIDQKVINENISANRVNADINHRGIFIEEADGIFDVGNEFQNILTGSSEIREAFKEDTWYASNPSKLYQNVFDSESKPNTITNSGANTFISFKNFTDVGTKMSFDISFGNANIKQILSLSLPGFIPSWLTSVNSLGNTYFVVGDSSGNANQIDVDGNIKSINNFVSTSQPAIVPADSNFVMIGSSSDILNVYYSGNTFTEQINSEITSQVVISSLDLDNVFFYFGTADGRIFKYKFHLSGTGNLSKLEEKQSFDDTEEIQSIILDGDNYFVLSNAKIIDFSGRETNLIDSIKIRNAALTKDKLGDYIIEILYDVNNSAGKNSGILIVKNGKIEKNVDLGLAQNISNFSLADLNNDGNNIAVFTENDNISSVNPAGFSSDNFPAILAAGSVSATNPLIVDLNSDDRSDIISVSLNGTISAVSGLDGSLLDGFPISIGNLVRTAPTMLVINNKTVIAAITDNGHFSAWNLNNSNIPVVWSGKYANNFNNGFVANAKRNNEIVEYFPDSKAYNWPNPVYGTETRIRFYVNTDSHAEVNIFDLGGELVSQLSANAIGGMDNEITWDVSNIQSGVYFAHLEVSANSGGQNSSKNIKIVIIK